MREEEFYAAQDALMEEIEREQEALMHKRKSVVMSTSSTAQSTFHRVSDQGNASASISGSRKALATSKSRVNAVTHSISGSSASTSSIRACKQSGSNFHDASREETPHVAAGKQTATSKRSASPVDDPPRKRLKKDEKTLVIEDSNDAPESDDISMFTTDNSSSDPNAIKFLHLGDGKVIRQQDGKSTVVSSKNFVVSDHASSKTRKKPIKTINLNDPSAYVPSSSKDVKGKSKASVASSRETAIPIPMIPFDPKAENASFRSTSSRAIAKSKSVAKTAPVSESSGRRPIPGLVEITPSTSKVSAPAETSKSSRSRSSTSNITKNAPVTKHASRSKAKPKPLTEKAKRAKYNGMSIRNFVADIYQRKSDGEFETSIPFLKGMVFFYCPNDFNGVTETSRKRSELLVRHGGTVQLDYDPTTVTHIVAEGGQNNVTKRLKIDSIMDIPDHVPTVTWEWVSMTANIMTSTVRRKDGTMPYDRPNLFPDCNDYAAFPARKRREPSPVVVSYRKHPPIKRRPSTPPPPQRSGSDTETDNDEPVAKKGSRRQLATPANSSGDEFGPNITSPPEPQPVASSSNSQSQASRPTVSDDPLAEFYAQAQREHDLDTRLGNNYGQDLTDNEDEKPRGAPAKRGWTCDKPYEPGAKASPNQDIADKLKELQQLHESKPGTDNKFRAISYQRSIPGILNHPTRIKSLREAREIRGVGEKTAVKIMEIIDTGELQRIKYENTEDVKVARIFTGIYGVGQNIAMQWYANGLRTLDDVRQRKFGIKLSSSQEIGLQFYDDINSRMPRAEAGAIFDLIKPIALKIDAKLTVDIMGSYRRGKADCGDIDILITRPTDDRKTHYGVMTRLWRDLHAANILTEDLSLPEDMNALECCYRGLCKLPGAGSRRRRLDILMVPWLCRGAALLYYTGDDIFNRAMRLKANTMGYSLNQRGLYAGVVRNPRDRREKTNAGNIIASSSEREIFKILKVPWQEPWQRVRSG